MGKKDVGCIYNRIVLGHFYEMLLFATTWLDLEGITLSSLGACTGSHSLAYYPVSRKGGQWVLPFYRLNVLDTNQKVPDISQGFIYMHITHLHQLHEFSRLDFCIKPKGDTSTSCYHKACLLQLLLIHSAPKCKPWVAPRDMQCPPPPDCEYMWLIHCHQSHLRSVGYCVFESVSRVQLFVTPWTVVRQAPLSVGFPWQWSR